MNEWRVFISYNHRILRPRYPQAQENEWNLVSQVLPQIGSFSLCCGSFLKNQIRGTEGEGVREGRFFFSSTDHISSLTTISQIINFFWFSFFGFFFYFFIFFADGGHSSPSPGSTKIKTCGGKWNWEFPNDSQNTFWAQISPEFCANISLLLLLWQCKPFGSTTNSTSHYKMDILWLFIINYFFFFDGYSIYHHSQQFVNKMKNCSFLAWANSAWDKNVHSHSLYLWTDHLNDKSAETNPVLVDNTGVR